MILPDINPILVQIGPFAIRWYALAYIAGIVLGWRYAARLTRNPRLWGASGPTANAAQIDDLVLWATLGVILGGRLGYVLFYATRMIWEAPLEIFKVWEGGMSFHGGLIGVIVAVVLYARSQKIDVLRLGDLVAPAVPFGLFFGRIANFINGELWGRPTDLPWGVVFCNSHLPRTLDGSCFAGPLPRHPSQLYEAALEGIVLFVILLVATHRLKWLRRRGGIVGLFLFFYAAFRIALETVRQPDFGLDALPLGLTMGMILSVPMALVGLWLVWRAWRARPEPEAPAQAPPAA